MGLSSSEVKKVKEEFLDGYIKPELKIYAPTCGISNLHVMKVWRHRTFDLKDGESLEDLCLHVSFGEKPSTDTFPFPDEYKEVRIFYSVIGKIKPL